MYCTERKNSDIECIEYMSGGHGLEAGDRRPTAERPAPPHALTAEERARILEVANEPRFAEVPPARIVPMLADDGVYLGSESRFHQVLKAEGQAAPRPGQGPAGRKAADDAHRHGAESGWVLGQDLPDDRDRRGLVLPLPDPRHLPPQDRRLGGTGP